MVQAEFLYGDTNKHLKHWGKWKHDPVLLPNASASCTYSTIKICVNSTVKKEKRLIANSSVLTTDMHAVTLLRGVAANRGREGGAALILTCSRIQDIQMVGCLSDISN